MATIGDTEAPDALLLCYDSKLIFKSGAFEEHRESIAAKKCKVNTCHLDADGATILISWGGLPPASRSLSSAEAAMQAWLHYEQAVYRRAHVAPPAICTVSAAGAWASG